MIAGLMGVGIVGFGYGLRDFRALRFRGAL